MKFKAKDHEFAKQIWDHQWGIGTISYIRTIRIPFGWNNWDLETYKES